MEDYKVKNIIEGQLAELIYKNEGENAQWQYCVVENIYDDRIQFLKEDGYRYMHVINTNDNENSILANQKSMSNLTLLYKDGKPVMAKKKLFGGYIVKPK
jgi:hypothetical protein